MTAIMIALLIPVAILAMLHKIEFSKSMTNFVAWLHKYTLDEVFVLLPVVALALIVDLFINHMHTYHEIERLSIRDPLTGLYNRRYLYTKLGRELERSLRYETPLSCVIVDIDHFKSINDRFGHLVGDSVLAEISSILLDSARKTDIVARLGGEEFVVLCPNTPATAIMPLAERIRESVMAHRFCAIGDEHVTVSAGVASNLRMVCSSTPEALLDCADKAMYIAKQHGRNRVEMLDAEAA